MALGTGTKIGLGIALTGALAVLVLSNPGEGMLDYVYVDQLMSEPADYTGRMIKVHGTVVEGTIKQKRGSTGDYRFIVEHEGERLAVHFTNIPPDTFQEGGEVILTGRLNKSADLFESEEMSAKCPSKYEEEQTVRQPDQQG